MHNLLKYLFDFIPCPIINNTIGLGFYNLQIGSHIICILSSQYFSKEIKFIEEIYIKT